MGITSKPSATLLLEHMKADSAEAVLACWFGSEADDAKVAEEKNALWWGGSAELDREIAKRFGDLRESTVSGRLSAWESSARSRLALIILVDQFSRNLFRDDARAFAADARARRWCLDGLALGHDLALRAVERVFFYLPLEHSESREDQAKSVSLYTTLAAEAPASRRKLMDGYLDFAVRHRRIVDRFGRFPHRNAVLGRTSTAEELAFLKEPGSSF